MIIHSPVMFVVLIAALTLACSLGTGQAAETAM